MLQRDASSAQLPVDLRQRYLPGRAYSQKLAAAILTGAADSLESRR